MMGFDNANWGRSPVYLVYLDDSETKQKDRKFQVMSAVIIKDEHFIDVELAMGLDLGNLLPQEMMNQFEEFHASELYGGYGVFEGIEEWSRFTAMRNLLGMVSDLEFPVVYGAVDQNLLSQQLYASASPIDIAFRLCVEGIEDWIVKHPPSTSEPNSLSDFALLIVDDCDKNTKATMRQTFRCLRGKIRPPNFEPGKLGHVHDDLYFGDSKDSVGIQLADVCSYVIAKHLIGDESIAEFYQIIEKQIVYGRVEPNGQRQIQGAGELQSDDGGPD